VAYSASLMQKAMRMGLNVLRNKYQSEYNQYVAEAKSLGKCHTSLYYYADVKIRKNHPEEWSYIFAVEGQKIGYTTHGYRKLMRIEKLRAEIKQLQKELNIVPEEEQ
jgi:hypothetical protein